MSDPTFDDVPLNVGIDMAHEELARDTENALLDEKVTAMWNELFASFDPKRGLRRLIYRGFDSFEDYERYGDAYVSLNVTNRR